MSKKISETLTAARAIIADPAKWTQGAVARDAAGRSLTLHSTDAVCYCADGALALAAGAKPQPGGWDTDPHYRKCASFLRSVAQTLTGKDSYIGVNDMTAEGEPKACHAAVLALFEHGASIAKSREELGLDRVPPR
jgi:hypothetical protein